MFAFRRAKKLAEVHAATAQTSQSSLVGLFKAGYAEIEAQIAHANASMIRSLDSVERSLLRASRIEAARLSRYLPFLATTAAASPFIGLFGTVWGIMDAFATIGATATTSITSVAPGISEALINTAAGLFAAIPALLAYNHFDHGDDYGDMAEINVTPLVDVMLVLLIIFMVTAPMLTQGLTVALPAAEGKSFELASNNPAKIQVTASGAVYLDGIAAGSINLDQSLGPMLRARRVKRALLEADKAVPYGRVVAVLDIMNRAGVEQLGMVTQPKERDGRSHR